eukprot:TRINITY_DN20245_c0_g1_i2.p1 TRINITY_DN20245_c0_g1~~TRINITY_DN20245_c0_g1_i2.p1  ORF type:complete len:596 (-),score=140.42 TRINITY_DN20245_c0_g1_i2:113-1900(-)
MGSFEMPGKMRSSALLEPSCGYLLQELKLIWDEIGQDQIEKEKVLLELEQECLDVYRRKVDGANIARARLHQSLADSEAEFTHLLVSLGERSFPSRPEKITGTLKEQLDSITPALREMQLRKEERVNQFRAVQMQIQKISAEIEGLSELNISPTDVPVNENDLSLKKLDEYRVELQRLHREKNDRLRKVEEYTSSVRNLATTMGMDAPEIIATVHPSLDASCGQQSKNISDAILARLNSTVESLKEEKQKRLEKLHKLGKSLKNLWNLMDTSFEDRRSFSHITGFISASAADVWKPGSLALDIIHQAEAEVERLDQLKASKMKELFLKKQLELEEICKRTHMEIPSQSEINNIMNLINSGEIDHADLLASMDEQISKAKEEAYSRTDIMEKVEKWIVSSEEERWLEEYSRDENRYSVSRGAHKNLKRAERARITVNKIAALVDSIMAKIKSWEAERKKVFMYDEVPLLPMLEEYNLSRQEKEEEKQRQRERKKMQSQVVQKENLFQTRPSTSSRRLSSRSLTARSVPATPLNRRLSVGIQQLGSNSICSASQGTSFIKDCKMAQGTKMRIRYSNLSHLRDDTASQISELSSPFSS